MPRIISTAMDTATRKVVTRPGYFIQIQGATTFRWCTRSDTSWNSMTWAAQPVTVSGTGSSGNGTNAPSLSIKDVSGAVIAAALSGDFKDAPVHIWVMDRNATEVGDPVLVFSGAVNGISCDVPQRTISITLAVAKASSLFSPRLTYGPEIGVRTTIPRGTTLVIGTKEYKVERR